MLDEFDKIFSLLAILISFQIRSMFLNPLRLFTHHQSQNMRALDLKVVFDSDLLLI